MDDTPFSSDEEDANALRKRDAPRAADPHDFGAAEEALNDAARRVNAVWISFIVLCVYIFIATYTVTPAALFRDAPVKLPIFDAELPLKVYFVMAPVLILALHAYLIVLTKGLGEKTAAYEDVLSSPNDIAAINAAGRDTLRSRLDNSIIIRAMNARYRGARGVVDHASGFIAGLTMTVTPVALLLLTQLVFLPYQDQWLTWVHRFFVVFDVGMCLWLLWPLTPWRVMARRSLVLTFILFAVATSVLLAAFPGEWIYAKLDGSRVHDLTVKMFEGPPDPVDYVHRGGVLPFPNRMILPDDPKLAENAGASSGGVSLSVRGRNFRKAVFDRSNLARVDFSAADLEEASLQGAKLEGAKFECGTPGQVIFEPFDRAVDVQREKDRDCAKLERANFWNATLDGASFREARMNDARLGRASLKGALFRGARMNGAILQAAALDNANFSGAELLGASFLMAHGNNVIFYRARLTSADFRNTRLLAANFNGASLQGARLFYAELPAANFDNAHMQGADLSGAALSAASFNAAYLHDATLDRANIKGAFFPNASLQGASLQCVTPFRIDFGNVELAFSEKIEKKNPGAKLLETIVNYPIVKCDETGWYDYTYVDTYNYYTDLYDGIGDHMPRDSSDNSDWGWGGSDGWGTYSYNTSWSDDIFTHPEKLSPEDFKIQVNKILADLPDEKMKSRVSQAFERLNPATRTTKQDDAEKAFWADWTRRSAPQESHDKALAERLEAIACVAEGAPYVARGLLLAGRFAPLQIDEKMNDEEKARIKRTNERNLGILERLKGASRSGDSKCPGAKGLVEADFPKPAP